MYWQVLESGAKHSQVLQQICQRSKVIKIFLTGYIDIMVTYFVMKITLTCLSICLIQLLLYQLINGGSIDPSHFICTGKCWKVVQNTHKFCNKYGKTSQTL